MVCEVVQRGSVWGWGGGGGGRAAAPTLARLLHSSKVGKVRRRTPRRGRVEGFTRSMAEMRRENLPERVRVVDADGCVRGACGCGRIWVHMDANGCVRVRVGAEAYGHMDAYGCVRVRVGAEAYGHIRMHMDA